MSNTQDSINCKQHNEWSIIKTYRYCPICYDWLDAPEGCSCDNCKKRPKDVKAYIIVNRLK